MVGPGELIIDLDENKAQMKFNEFDFLTKFYTNLLLFKYEYGICQYY